MLYINDFELQVTLFSKSFTYYHGLCQCSAKYIRYKISLVEKVLKFAEMVKVATKIIITMCAQLKYQQQVVSDVKCENFPAKKYSLYACKKINACVLLADLPQLSLRQPKLMTVWVQLKNLQICFLISLVSRVTRSP